MKNYQSSIFKTIRVSSSTYIFLTPQHISVSSPTADISNDIMILTLRQLLKPFDAHCCHMGTAMKHPVPDRVKPSFVIFDIRAI